MLTCGLLLSQNPDGLQRFKIELRCDADYVVYDETLREASMLQIGGAIPQRQETGFVNGEFILDVNLEFLDLVFIETRIQNLRISASGVNPFEDIIKLGEDTIDPLLAKLCVSVNEFWGQDVSIKFGMFGPEADFRKTGNPLFLSLSGAESAWMDINRTLPFLERNTLFSAGLEILYKRELLKTRIMAFPSAMEGGGTQVDEAVYLADLVYTLSFAEYIHVFLLGGYLAGGNDNLPNGYFKADKQRIYTLGVGVNCEKFFSKSLSVFIETYFQRGLAGNTTTGVLNHKGGLYCTGLCLNFKGLGAEHRIGLTFLYVSGDKTQRDDNEGRFISYENNDEFKITESDEWGFDIDSNYRSFRFSLSSTYKLFEKPLDFGIKVGYFETIYKLPLPPQALPPDLQREKRLGFENGVEVRYQISENIAFKTSFNCLLDSKILKLLTSEQKKSTFLWLLGFSVKL
jgi:hypothetical protein